MTNSTYTIDEYLKTRASLKNKIIAITVAIWSTDPKDINELERLKELQRAHLELYKAVKKIK